MFRISQYLGGKIEDLAQVVILYKRILSMFYKTDIEKKSSVKIYTEFPG